MDLLRAACITFFAALAIGAGQVSPPGAAPKVEELLSAAQRDLSSGNFDAAASGFRSVLARQPSLPEALFGLGIAAGQLGRMAEARDALRRYVVLQPSSPEGHTALGTVLLAAGDLAGARAELESAVRLQRDNFPAAKALAHVETLDYRGARAVALLRPFVTSPGFDDEARLDLAAGYEETGNAAAAVSTLKPLLERQPPAPEVFVLAAAAGWRAGDPAFAERACAAGLRLYLNSDEVEQRCLAIVSTSFVKGLEAALRVSPEDASTLIVLGRLLTDAAKTADSPVRERGLKLLERAVAVRGADATALYNLGRCLRVLARPEEAIRALERALTAQPDDGLQTLISTQIGLAEQDLQHDAQAEKAFRCALELNRALARHLPQSAFDFCTFLAEAGREEEAAAVLDEILRWDPAFLPARMERAQALAGAGRLEEAIRQAEFVARNTDPVNQRLLRQAHLLLLKLYTKMGRRQEAARQEAWLRRAQAERRR